MSSTLYNTVRYVWRRQGHKVCRAAELVTGNSLPDPVSSRRGGRFAISGRPAAPGRLVRSGGRPDRKGTPIPDACKGKAHRYGKPSLCSVPVPADAARRRQTILTNEQ